MNELRDMQKIYRKYTIEKLRGKTIGRAYSPERKKALNKTYADIASQVSIPERGKFSTRRIFNRLERQYLSQEAQALAYCLLNTQSVPVDVTENTIQQAVTLGTMSGAEVDAQTFEALFHAVALNPSFKLPFAFAVSTTFFNSWVC
jgi:hypothetical protein